MKDYVVMKNITNGAINHDELDDIKFLKELIRKIECTTIASYTLMEKI